MYLCEMTGAYTYSQVHIHKYMVLQCSKLFYYKVSSEFLQQDSQSSYIQFWQDTKHRRNRTF